jgi:hypothetical protein
LSSGIMEPAWWHSMIPLISVSWEGKQRSNPYEQDLCYGVPLTLTMQGSNVMYMMLVNAVQKVGCHLNSIINIVNIVGRVSSSGKSGSGEILQLCNTSLGDKVKPALCWFARHLE